MTRSRFRFWRFAGAAFASWFLLAWVAAHALVKRAALDRADAIVVLGGSAAFKERTKLAAEFYRQGRASRVILTNDGQRGGWSSAEQRNPFFVERAAEELRNAGVPAERIEALPQTVFSTREEAIALRDYATAKGFKSLIVVTSAYHSRRALWILRRLFERSGIAIGVEPIPPGEQTAQFATWWLYPSGWRDVAGEYAKLAYYHARY